MKIKLRLLQGFTLMEMMVVIVIVGLLATIMTVIYVGAKATARDTQRFDDITTIIKAVDLYIVYNNAVPGEQNVTGVHLSEDCDSDLKNDLLGAGLLNKMPTDPLALNSCDATTFNNNSLTQAEDQLYFYAWRSTENCLVGNCLSINRTETTKLQTDLSTRFAELRMVTCSASGDFNIGTGDVFDYCFTDNRP